MASGEGAESPLARGERWLLVALVLASLFVHYKFILRGYAEQDAVRLSTDAFVWHRTGQLNARLADYRPWTSPLYLHGLKKLLDWGVPVGSLAGVMNWSNVFFGALTLVPVYLVARSLAGARAALAAVALYSFVPVFWIANIYGMPHLPSFGLFLVALLLFTKALSAGGRRFALLVGGAAAAMAVAMSLKADVVLLGGAFLGVMLCKRKLTLRHLATGLAIGLAGIAVSYLYARLIQPQGASAAGMKTNLDGRFPLRLERLVGARHWDITVAAFGPVLFWACVAALIACGLVRRACWRLAALALLWSVPAQLVWAMKFGNSGRHMMAPALGLILLLAAALVSLLGTRRRVALAVAALVAANYWSTAPDAGTVLPSTRLLESVPRIQEITRRCEKAGKKFTALPGEKKLIVGRGKMPYAFHEALVSARSFEFGPDGVVRLLMPDGETQLVSALYINNPDDWRAAAAREKEGWRLWSGEFNVRKGLEEALGEQQEQDAPPTAD